LDKAKRIYMEKKINDNGYEYVDLGLPSGTLWATKLEIMLFTLNEWY